MRRIVLSFIAGLVLVAVAAPGAHARGDLWTGVWQVGGCCTDTGARTAYGTILLQLQADDQTITGTYAFSGGGTLRAELNRPFGHTMTGTYRDGTGKGRFKATLRSSTTSFDGWSKPCRLLCRSQDWWGERQ